MMGKKSNSSFIGWASFLFGLEIEGGGVHAIAQAAVGGPVVEHMAEVRAALRAHGLDADHAVGRVADLLDRTGHGLVEARPAAVRVELVRRIEQLVAAADAVVAAVGPHALVFAGERALRGGAAGDLER